MILITKLSWPVKKEIDLDLIADGGGHNGETGMRGRQMMCCQHSYQYV